MSRTVAPGRAPARPQGRGATVTRRRAVDGTGAVGVRR
jgi:hypothetical protein